MCQGNSTGQHQGTWMQILPSPQKSTCVSLWSATLTPSSNSRSHPATVACLPSVPDTQAHSHILSHWLMHTILTLILIHTYALTYTLLCPCFHTHILTHTLNFTLTHTHPHTLTLPQVAALAPLYTDAEDAMVPSSHPHLNRSSWLFTVSCLFLYRAVRCRKYLCTSKLLPTHKLEFPWEQGSPTLLMTAFLGSSTVPGTW